MNGNKKIITLKKRDIEERLKKLQYLDSKITWDAFFATIDEYTKAQIKKNYLIPYARYLERKLRDLLPKMRTVLNIYERIDDKVEMNYICDLERKLRDFHTKIRLELLKKHPVKYRRPSEIRPTLEKKINDYISLKMVNNKTLIYVNGKRFIQCIRLILNIPKNDAHLYEEVNSIDEAAKLYSNHVFQNRIVRGPMAALVPNQYHDITAEQEFWGHCSNIQAWVEHDYDTRILMSNISFPLLRELTMVGDPLAKKVFKEEVALRLESGHPSVVQYLLTQGYTQVFSSDEFKTIIESSEIIRKLTSEPIMLSRFITTCIRRFPNLLEIILLRILKLSNGREIFISSFINPKRNPLRSYIGYNPRLLPTLKKSLANLSEQADDKLKVIIRDCSNLLEEKLKSDERELYTSYPNYNRRMEAIKKFYQDQKVVENLEIFKNLMNPEQLMIEVLKNKKNCSYCGKEIPKGKLTCDWCGHRKDDGGFFPYPYIFKPPGGGGGDHKEGALVISVMV